MKKTFIFMVLVLMGVSGFVYALMDEDSSGRYDVEIHLEEGWNIIAGTIPEGGISEDSEIQSSDIKAMWYYSPFQKDYVEVHPNTDWTNINKDDEDFALTTAMWIYSKKSGTIKYNTLEDYQSLENRQLISGWNFVTLTPDMVDGFADSCNVEKSYFWDIANDEWLVFPYDNPQEFTWDGDSVIGYGMVLKVSSDCNLSGSGHIPAAGASFLARDLPEFKKRLKSLE